jgi:urease accessory protein
MSGAACPSEGLQRAVGGLSVSFKRFGAETVLDDLRQDGCLKARFPRRVVPGWLDAVMLNTGGGVAGGDRLSVLFEAGAGTSVTIAAQAAERFYRARDADLPSFVRTRLVAGAGAALEWLPQETILFDRASLDRRLEVEVAADATFLGIETLVLGRAAMGEVMAQGRVRDLVRVRLGGELLLHDAVRLDSPVAGVLAGAATAGGAHVVATVVYVGADAGGRVEAVRGALVGVEAGVSAWNGMLVARVLGRDSASVRGAAVAALGVLRGGRPMPRVWGC